MRSLPKSTPTKSNSSLLSSSIPNKALYFLNERLNRGIWRLLEVYERNLAATGTVEVEIRMVYSATSQKLPTGATVPDGFYKIITFGNKIEKYYFPNTSPTSSDFKTYIVK